MNNSWVLCLAVGISWGLAPVLGRLSGVSAMPMAVLLAAGTLLATLPFSNQHYGDFTAKAITLALLAGLVNGAGLIAFYRLVAGSGEGLWELSKVLPVALILVPVVIALFAKVLFSEPLTAQKIIGLVLAGTAIWFLK